MDHHDHHYRRLFSQPEMLRALIVGMLPAEWVDLLRLDTLEPIPTDHIADRQMVRQGDLLWRVRRSDDDELYLLLLLEHQARRDRLMSIRTLSYTALACETLVRRRLVPPNRALPAVLPIVLYSGAQPWRHPVEVGELLDPVPASLEPYQPRMRYILIDEGEWVRRGSLPEGNLAALLFRLEHNHGVDDAAGLLHVLCERLKGEQYQELYRAFGQWVRHILLPRAWPKRIFLPNSEDLKEIATMTATLNHSRDWTLKFRLEGREEGRKEGLRQGQADVLRRQMQRKFGAVPAAVEARLASASFALLESWSLNLLDAESIDDVFRE